MFCQRKNNNKIDETIRAHEFRNIMRGYLFGCVLSVRSDPVNDSILVEIVLVFEGRPDVGLLQFRDEGESRSIIIVPLFGDHLQQVPL